MGAGAERTLTFAVHPPSDFAPGTFWGLVKVMYFGRLWYTLPRSSRSWVGPESPLPRGAATGRPPATRQFSDQADPARRPVQGRRPSTLDPRTRRPCRPATGLRFGGPTSHLRAERDRRPRGTSRTRPRPTVSAQSNGAGAGATRSPHVPRRARRSSRAPSGPAARVAGDPSVLHTRRWGGSGAVEDEVDDAANRSVNADFRRRAPARVQRVQERADHRRLDVIAHDRPRAGIDTDGERIRPARWRAERAPHVKPRPGRSRCHGCDSSTGRTRSPGVRC